MSQSPRTREGERVSAIYELACHRQRTLPGHDVATARWARSRLGSQMLRLYSQDPVQDRLFHVASDPPETAPSFALRASDVLLGKALEGLRPLDRPLAGLDEAAVDRFPPELDGEKAWLWMIPVKNTWNTNQVLALMVAFFADRPELKMSGARKIAADVAVELEEGMRDRILAQGNELDHAIREIETPTQRNACKALANVLLGSTPANRCEVYLANSGSIDLYAERAVRSGGFRKLGAAGDSLVRACLESNREILQVAPLDAPRRVPATSGGTTTALRCLCLIPIRDHAGSALGVVRLEMEEAIGPGHGERCLNYDDLSVADEIAQRFVPHLRAIREQETRRRRLTFLVHEMRLPIVTFRAALERLSKECRSNGFEFRFDHFREMDIYCEIMKRLVKHLEMTQLDRLRLNPQKIALLAAVIAPAVRFIEPLMRSRRLKLNQIQRFKNLDSLPSMYLDPRLMTQVVFNLLENALKYFDGPPSSFWLEIEGSSTLDAYEVAFRDHGIGIPNDYKERVFDLDVRAPNALSVAQGDGIGLWLSRTIVRLHGGDLFLSRLKDPTEFVVRLPRGLVNLAPVADELGEHT